MLNPSNEYVEKVCISLVREYLIKREFSQTLKSFNMETAPSITTIGFYGSRLALGTDLGLEGLMKLNKQSEHPFKTMLEVLVKCFIQDREFLLRSNFANSCYYPNFNHHPQKHVSRKEEPEIIGSQAFYSRNSSHSKSEESFESHPRHQLNTFKQKPETKILHNDNQTQENNVRPPPLVIQLEAHPMALFCEKLKEQSKILNYGKGSMSLEHENIEGNEGSSNSWIAESNYDSHKLPQNPQLQSVILTAPVAERRIPKILLERSNLTLGQSLLETKQNLLAQVSLSPEENEIRQQAQIGTDSESSSSSKKTSSSTTVTTDQGFKIRDIDSLESCKSGASGKTSFFQKSVSRSSHLSVTRMLDNTTWKELKGIVLGDRGIMQEGWISQGFVFSFNVPYGLVQKKGGPCGVLAVVQALLLRNLMFGSPYCDPSEFPMKDFAMILASSSLSKNLVSARSNALIGALAEILWRCGSGDENNPARNPVIIGFTTQGGVFGPGTELRVFDDLDDLKIFVEANLHRFDCIGLLYSVVLTRGIQRVQSEMDFSNSPLLGQHGYCTQELMNLLTVGRAISNAFDNEYVLGEKILKGISKQADIGLLSLFEHYNSCRVGSYLKNPKFPLWIVCSESHFTLLFSPDMNLTMGNGCGDAPAMKNFDLYYYDGLARQDRIIKLSISFASLASSENGPNAHQSKDNVIPAISIDDDMIPPLEKCIRTRWSGVSVDWNESEPIL